MSLSMLKFSVLIRLRVSGDSGHADEEQDTSQSTLDEFTKSTLQPTLDAQQTLERIDSIKSLFQPSKRTLRKARLADWRFENFQRLLCGTRTFPYILLLNLKNDRPPSIRWDGRSDSNPNLARRCPEWNQSWTWRCDHHGFISKVDRRLVGWTPCWARSSYCRNVRVDPWRYSRVQVTYLPTILSCQCFRPSQHERWGSFHGMLQNCAQAWTVPSAK